MTKPRCTVVRWLLVLNLFGVGALFVYLLTAENVLPDRGKREQTAHAQYREHDVMDHVVADAYVQGGELDADFVDIRLEKGNNDVSTNVFTVLNDSKSKRRKTETKLTTKDVSKSLTAQQNVLWPIDPVPEASVSDYIESIPVNIMKSYLRLPYKTYKDRIIILTPIRNVAHRLPIYTRALQTLSYPHRQISIAFGEDGSTDCTVDIARTLMSDLEDSSFYSVLLFNFNVSSPKLGKDWHTLHSKDNQYLRRKHIAKIRNLLSMRAIRDDHDWVLWIDSDVTELPVDLIEQLLYPQKDIVATSCVYRQGLSLRVFDRNTWRETEASLSELSDMPKDQLMLEGYGRTKRIYLPHLRAEGRVVPLDGVGGCSLLVRAECHRQKLIFPEEVYNHHIETEGLAKMARDMGFGVYGLPFVEVIH